MKVHLRIDDPPVIRWGDVREFLYALIACLTFVGLMVALTAVES